MVVRMHLRTLHTGAIVGALMVLTLCGVRGGDVAGYSVMKGRFLLQTSADALELDPDFGFSFLASVDLSDFDTLRSASIRFPEGESAPMDDLGDYWSYLDMASDQEALDAAYVWGDYVLRFSTVNEGEFSCLVTLLEADLPPVPRLVNFPEVQYVDPARPITLRWDYDAPPRSDDFVQVYINLGHGEVFATPNSGEEGALDGKAHSVTLPPDTLVPGRIHNLNLEITRVGVINADCYPGAEGVGALFSSTAVAVLALMPPELRLLSASHSAPALSFEAIWEPGQRLILQRSADLVQWRDWATNSAPSGSNVFVVPLEGGSPQFFRAWQPPEPAGGH